MPPTPNELLAHGDAALAELARAGNSEAFAELWSRHVGAGTVAARQFSGIADADDIVSESYLRIFRAMQHGGGPHEAFRPYLYRTIRNIALDWRAKQVAVSLEETAELEEPDSDPQLAVLENVVTARAFRELPERWQAVLWYIDVEGMSPAEAAPMVGLSPNATSALSLRAREGFKKAWLQAHVNDLTVPAECRWTNERMAQYSRRTLSPRARGRFDRHLEGCVRCSILIEEIGDLSGHLASVLIIAALGSGAGLSLLGQLSPSAPSPSAVSTTQKALIAGAGTAVLVLVASGALAITAPWQPVQSAPSADAAADPPRITPSPTVSTGDPNPTAPTHTPPPPVPPVNPPVSPPIAPPPPPVVDRTAPGIPAQGAPTDGTLTNVAEPVFSGTGEPGARVDVERVDPMSGTLILVATTTVGPNGHWTVRATQPLTDGTHQVRVTQVDPAGNRSDALATTLTVDTIALAPIVDSLPVGPVVFLPDVTGDGEPGATVTLRDESSTAIATALVGQDGRWSVVLPDPQRDGSVLTATQLDAAGNSSPASSPSAAITFQRPQIPTPAPATLVPSTGGSTVVQVELAGLEGYSVQVYIDGLGTGNLHTLEATPIVRVTPPLADGVHSIGVRYFDPNSGRPGSMYVIEIRIG